MTFKELKNYRDENYPDTILFENPDYAGAFIGMTSDDRAVYDYELMVQELMKKDDFTRDDAIDFVDYNTIRSLSYFLEPPIVLYKFEDEF